MLPTILAAWGALLIGFVVGAWWATLPHDPENKQ